MNLKKSIGKIAALSLCFAGAISNVGAWDGISIEEFEELPEQTQVLVYQVWRNYSRTRHLTPELQTLVSQMENIILRRELARRESPQDPLDYPDVTNLVEIEME